MKMRQRNEELDALKKLLRYDASTGDFFYIRSGKKTGHKTKRGYIVVNANNKQYQAHQIAYFFINGTVAKQIDHINRIRSDNRIENLRDVKPIQNATNRSRKPRSGVIGVEIIKTKNKTIYRARTNKCQIGCFDNIEDARSAYINHYKILGVNL